jgi:NAD(P)-dependent dehydrogenase (short-subunit alcohol dehydrogenase family)
VGVKAIRLAAHTFPNAKKWIALIKFLCNNKAKRFCNKSQIELIMNMIGKLQNKVVYITGGSKGIGYGIAKTLLNKGMRVAITSRSLSAAKEAVASLSSNASKILALESDVSSLASEQKAIKAVIDHFGQLDVLVANAGVGHFASIETLTEEDWKNTIETNLTGVFNSVKASIEALKQSKGYIITIASLAGTNFFENGAAYNASKFGLVGFTQAIMLDLRKYGIKVTTIMPGSVATNFNDHTPTDADAWKIQPEDIGQLVTDLLSMHPRTLPSKIEVRPSMPGK